MAIPKKKHYQRYAFENQNGREIKYEEPRSCPHCGVIMTPKFQKGFMISASNIYIAVGHFKCDSCDNEYLVAYNVTMQIYRNGAENNIGDIWLYFPNTLSERYWGETFQKYFNDFIIIYEQARKAEELNLNHAAGITYRKAIEFLVVDFLILKDESFKDKFKEKPITLSQCINMIDDEDIKSLALVSAWIGNDQTHYNKALPEFDIEDMKKFIEVLIYYIDKYMSVLEAKQIIEQKKQAKNQAAQ